MIARTLPWSLAWIAAANVVAAELAPEFVWARKSGSDDSEQGRAIAAGADGGVYVTGFFSGTNQFGSTSLISSGLEDIFVAKYDSAGNLIWARKAGGAGYDEGHGIAVDPSGNVLVAGLFQGTATFSGTNVTAAGESDVFIAKYSSAGNLLWVRKAGGNDFDEADSIAVDGAGNVYVTGSFDATATFGGITLTNTHLSSDVFVAKADAQGGFLWARAAGGSGDDSGNGIALDTNGNIYVTGFFSGMAPFGSTNLTSAGANAAKDIFIAKYNNAGALNWVWQAGGTNDDFGNAVAVDEAGNIFSTGQFRGAAAFGSTNLVGNGADIFLSRLDAAGNLVWARRAGGNDVIYGDQGFSVQLDRTGGVYVAGYFSGTASFGTTNVPTTGFDDIFVAKYDLGGRLLWVERAGGTQIDAGSALAVDASNNVYVTGFFYGTMNVAGTNLISSGLEDLIVAKLQPVSPPGLTVLKSTDSVVFSWPLSPSGFVLEFTDRFPGTQWTAVTAGTNATSNVATQSTSGVQKFYRLRKS